MPKNTKIILEWNYSPKDFFEKKTKIDTNQYEMVIDNGKITVTIDGEIYDDNPSIREQLNNFLEDRFLGAQLVNRKPYELSKSSLCRNYPDGKKNYEASVETLGVVVSVGTLDVIAKDAEGNVISDSKQDRINKREHFAELSEKYRRSDTTADGILVSFDKSVRDPANELVHLYEILDALKNKFNGKDAARKILGIKEGQWNRLGILANSEPLNQGRHRGGRLGDLRDATLSELNEAREIAIEMIYKYLIYLESNRNAYR